MTSGEQTIRDAGVRHVTRRELVRFLKSYYRDSPAFFARNMAIYRPLICPFDRLLNLLPERQRILDIGCGTGVFLQLIARYRSPSALGGLETNQRAIESARKIFQSSHDSVPARLEVYDGVTLPDWIREYDYVLLVDVLHHIPRHLQKQTLRALLEKLKPKAKLIIKDIDAGQRLWCLFNKLHDLLVARQYPHECAAAELRNQLTQLGFEVTRMMQERIYVYPHYTIVSEKKRDLVSGVQVDDP